MTCPDIGSTTVGAYCTLPENVATFTKLTSPTTHYTYTDNSNITDTFNSSGQLTSEGDLAAGSLTVTGASYSSGHATLTYILCYCAVRGRGRSRSAASVHPDTTGPM